MGNLVAWLIASVILWLQHYLSRRKSMYWGALLPVAYVAFLIVLYARGIHGGIITLVLPAIIGMLILLVNWSLGRDALKKKRKKELEKIQLNDL